MSDGGYNPYAVHARGLSMFQGKMGDNCPSFLWNRGNPILFDGTDGSWAISPNTVRTKEKLTSGGFGSDFALRFSVLTANLYAAPTVTTPMQLRLQLIESPIGYQGDAYKVTNVEISPDGLVLTIDANAENQDG